MDGNGSSVVFEGQTPILRVADLAASVAHYTEVLGFTLDWQQPGIMASVSRGRAGLFLCEGDQGHAGGWVWIGVSDSRRLFEEYTAKGARIRVPPTNHPWALEMQVEDLDGNVLRLGSEPLPGHPFGEWLDMRGVRWAPRPEGGWRRVD